MMWKFSFGNEGLVLSDLSSLLNNLLTAHNKIVHLHNFFSHLQCDLQYFAYICIIKIFSYKEIVNSYKERFHSLNNPSPYRDFNVRLFALSIAMLSSEAR